MENFGESDLEKVGKERDIIYSHLHGGSLIVIEPWGLEGMIRTAVDVPNVVHCVSSMIPTIFLVSLSLIEKWSPRSFLG